MVLCFNPTNAMIEQKGGKYSPPSKGARFDAERDIVAVMNLMRSKLIPYVMSVLKAGFYLNRHGMHKLVAVPVTLFCIPLSRA